MYLTTGATPAPPREIRPQAGRQTEFLASPADIVIYGGSAGGGKTWGLLLDPLRHVHVDKFNGLILRRTFPEVTNLGGLWDESENLYPHAGGRGVRGDLVWRFASEGGRAVIEFGHLQHETDLMRYDGAQICYLAFDQLEHFTERMFFYMIGRNRSMCGVRPYVRATCNPDPDSFLVNFLAWWIAEDGYADLSRAGVIRWFVRINDRVIWADSKEDLLDLYPDSFPLSCTFIPATVYDNALLLAKDPEYIAKLQALPLVERQRFLGDRVRGGNWRVRPEAGKVFNRAWFEIVDSVPAGGVEARGWDLAATLRSVKNDDPDLTSGVKMRKVGGVFYVVDVINDRFAAGEVDSVMQTTIAGDLSTSRTSAARYKTRWEVEPGSAGLRETARLKRELQQKFPGIDADGTPSTGDKITKSRALAVACEGGKVKVLAAAWTDRFLAQLHNFPDVDHDDMVDSCAVAYNAIYDEPEAPAQRSVAPNPMMKRRNL